MDEHDIWWAFGKMCEGKPVSRENKKWAGQVMVRLKETETEIKKGDPLFQFVKGSVIMAPHMVLIKHGVIRPFSYDNEDMNATDWTLAGN